MNAQVICQKKRLLYGHDHELIYHIFVLFISTWSKIIQPGILPSCESLPGTTWQPVAAWKLACQPEGGAAPDLFAC